MKPLSKDGFWLPPDTITVLYMHGYAEIHKPDMELIAQAEFWPSACAATFGKSGGRIATSLYVRSVWSPERAQTGRQVPNFFPNVIRSE
jgi:hypothetical protein